MKSLIILLMLVCFCTVNSVRWDDDGCTTTVLEACGERERQTGGAMCNATYGGINSIESEIQAYINSQLSKSYEYLLMATHFNSYQENRIGFKKLYQGLSDRSFNDAIDLIRQITNRGGAANFNIDSPSSRSTRKARSTRKFAVGNALHSLAHALDNEKELSKHAMNIHRSAVNGDSTSHDPEMANYIENKFLGKQVKTVRKITGYINDLADLIESGDPSLAVHLLDDFLEKHPVQLGEALEYGLGLLF